jgi:hypothetical protein
MTAILAVDTAIDALPWIYVVALCGSLAGAIVVMWRRDVARESERSAREKAIADQARADAVANSTALTIAAGNMKEATDMMRLLVSRADAADTERRAAWNSCSEKIEEIRKVIEGCQGLR